MSSNLTNVDGKLPSNKAAYNFYDNDEREYENFNLFGEVACDDEYDFFMAPNEAESSGSEEKNMKMTRSITYSDANHHDNRSMKDDLTNVSRMDSVVTAGKTTKASSMLSSMTSYLISPARKADHESSKEDDVAHIFRRDSLNSCFDYRRSIGIGIGANLNYSNLNDSRSSSSRFSKSSPKQSDSSFRNRESVYNQIIFNKIDEIKPDPEQQQQQSVAFKRPTQLNLSKSFKKETSI